MAADGVNSATGATAAPPFDEAALASVIVALGALLCAGRTSPGVEVDPLRVTTGGLLALDALVVDA